MMKNITLKTNDIVQVSEGRRKVLYRMVDSKGFTGVGRQVKAGETIIRCVFKNNSIEPRSQYVLKQDMKWVPAHPKMQDTTEQSYNFTKIMCPELLHIVVDGHMVGATDSHTYVCGYGMTWSWNGKAKTKPEKLTTTQIKDMSFADAQAFARRAIDAYHAEDNPFWDACPMCQPPYHNVWP